LEPASGKRVSVDTITGAFYAGDAAEISGQRRLALLSSFQREAGRTRFSDYWTPILSLGTLIKAKDETGRMLPCMQPRCDSTRLKAVTKFPFQIVKRADQENFNLVVYHPEDVGTEVIVALKPGDLEILDFTPRPKEVVLASSVGKELIFTGVDGNTYR
jgi:hypothetical protein